ncbi:MAG: glycosyl hydrolase family 28-related protein [Waltera sp.]
MINILEYGAVGDGQTNDAPVIQKAIDTCAEQGGGVVLFPGGRTYSSGYVLLKSMWRYIWSRALSGKPAAT